MINEEQNIEKDVLSGEELPDIGERARAKKMKKPNVFAEFFEWFELLVISACFVIVLFTFFVRPARVVGESMVDTLHEGETLLISNLFYTPARGDVIVFQAPVKNYPDPIVKRVIATENQVVDIDYETWTVTVDGVPVDESGYIHLESPDRTSKDTKFPYTVPAGTVFVLGDNRNKSLDSRSAVIGAVDLRSILGKVVFRITPVTKIGTIN